MDRSERHHVGGRVPARGEERDLIDLVPGPDQTLKPATTSRSAISIGARRTCHDRRANSESAAIEVMPREFVADWMIEGYFA
jgi:hypothetical protein